MNFQSKKTIMLVCLKISDAVGVIKIVSLKKYRLKIMELQGFLYLKINQSSKMFLKKVSWFGGCSSRDKYIIHLDYIRQKNMVFFQNGKKLEKEKKGGSAVRLIK